MFFDSFFVLSPLNETIVEKQFRGKDRVRERVLAYLRCAPDACQLPFRALDNVWFVSVRRKQLRFVMCVDQEANACFALAVLVRLAALFRDHCGGSLDEDALRDNAPLLHAIVDEAVDFGYVQSASSAQLRALLREQAQSEWQQSNALIDFTDGARTANLLLSRLGLAPPPPASNLPNSSPVSRASMTNAPAAAAAASGDDARHARRAAANLVDNALYVDVSETLSLRLDASGAVMRADIDGDVSLTSTVSGTPHVRLRAQDSGVEWRSERVTQQHADAKLWRAERTLSVFASAGRLHLMRYRAGVSKTPSLRGGMPLQMAGRAVLDRATRVVSVRVRLRACVAPSTHLSALVVRVRLPHRFDESRSRCSVRSDGLVASSVATFEAARGGVARPRIVWRSERVLGNTELFLAADVALRDSARDNDADDAADDTWWRDETGPLACTFVAHDWAASALQLRVGVESANSDTQKTKKFIAIRTVCENWQRPLTFDVL